jgi:CRP-like cAMP-binding protein
MQPLRRNSLTRLVIPGIALARQALCKSAACVTTPHSVGIKGFVRRSTSIGIDRERGMHKEPTLEESMSPLANLIVKEGMGPDSPTEALGAVPLFAELDRRELESICAIASKRTNPKGSFIFHEGDRGETFYLILAGEVKIVIQGADGREFILTMQRAGDFFGEMSLFDDQPRSASVMTTEETTFLVLYKQEFLSQVKHSLPILFKFVLTLCQRLRYSGEKLGDLALLDVPRRVCKALVTLGKTAGIASAGGALIIPKRPTHQDLANMTGTLRETVTRVFNNLEKQGYISVPGRQVVIHRILLDRLGCM